MQNHSKYILAFTLSFYAFITPSNAQECLNSIDPETTTVKDALACIKSLSTSPPSLLGVPKGTIVAWYKVNEKIPQGWHVCDGSNGTPDLRGRFLRGVGSMSDAGLDPSGVETHSHTIQVGVPNTPANAGTHQGPDDLTIPHAGHGHTAASVAASNLPPNFRVVYLIKVD